MKRDLEFRKFWENLKESDSSEEQSDTKEVTDKDGETIIDSLIARLEELVSILENAVNKDSSNSEVDKEDEPKKEESKDRPRRISRRCRR